MMWAEISRLFQRAIDNIYAKLERCRFSYIFIPKQVRQDIKLLGQERKSYYIRKMQYTGCLIVFGLFILIHYMVHSFTEKGTVVTELQRPEAYQETEVYTLQVGEEAELYQIEVSPVEWTWEEADEKFREASNMLQAYMLGQNTSRDHIETNLYLPEYLDTYPFDIYWDSDRRDIVAMDGTVDRRGLEKDEIVVLTAEFHYKEWKWQEQFGILVCKEVLSQEEQYKRNFREMLISQEKANKNSQNWMLPEEFEGETITYQIVAENNNLLVFGLLVIGAGILMWFGQDQDLRSICKKRRSVFRLEYATLVNSLSLYITAGMNLQNAMDCCARDYSKRKAKEHALRIALERWQKNLQNGSGISAALQQFAEECEHASYKRLAGILMQGIQNGTRGITETLEQEAEQANEDKRRQSKIKGEQASTTLIMPMMLQLAIIIVLIMVPAFLGMQL